MLGGTVSTQTTSSDCRTHWDVGRASPRGQYGEQEGAVRQTLERPRLGKEDESGAAQTHEQSILWSRGAGAGVSAEVLILSRVRVRGYPPYKSVRCVLCHFLCSYGQRLIRKDKNK